MKRYKLLKNCQDGEWVYYDVGRLCQVQDGIIISGRVYKDLVDGYLRISAGENTKVYPLTLHAKVIAESVYSYYKRCMKKDSLTEVNGLIGLVRNLMTSWI